MSWLAHLCVLTAAGLLSKEMYEQHIGDPGAMDHLALGSMALLLVASFILVLLDSSVRRASGKPVLAVDLDECLCHYLTAFIRFSNARHGTSLAPEDFTSNIWEVPKCGLKSPEEAIERVYEFHNSHCAPASHARQSVCSFASRLTCQTVILAQILLRSNLSMVHSWRWSI